MKIDPLDISFEPLAGSTFTNLLRLIAQNNFKIELVGLPRFFYSIMMSLVLSPLNIYERKCYYKKIKEITIDKPPIFIIGHWRTGTTYLHNLLSQDNQFGYPTTFQTIVPGLFIGSEKLIKPIVVSSLPSKRPQDDVDLDADFPSEEEYAIGNLSPYSFYHGWCFPKNMEFYNKFVCLEDVSSNIIEDWKMIYLNFLKKLTLYLNGKQLILKNPPNTARIKLLIEMFPDAKFIHIYRNPYHVFLSMKRNIEKEMTLYALQTPPKWVTFEKAMVYLYNRMYEKYFEERKLIKKGNLIEIKYEDFIKNPIYEIERIYNDIGLNDFGKSKVKFIKYIDSQSKIKTFNYSIDKQLKKRIYDYFKPTIDMWGYDI
jgi:hypothetical protein